MSNNKRLTLDDLCNLLAQETYKGSLLGAKRYLKGLYKVILKQLKLNNKIYLHDFGVFEVKPRKSGERLMGDPKDGGSRVVYIKPRLSIVFRESEVLDLIINENDFEFFKGGKTKKKELRTEKNKSDINQDTIDLIYKSINRANNKDNKKEKESNET